MMIKKRRRQVPGLNTTSTADISFMLLIFFLVTTSMDVDKGLLRQLPPAQNNQEQQVSEVEKSTLMAIKITPANEILLNEQPVSSEKLQPMIERFVAKYGKRHLISLDVDAASSYQTYITLQNEIAKAYHRLRNRLATKQFGYSYDACTTPQKETIREVCPMRIMEKYNPNGKEVRP